MVGSGSTKKAISSPIKTSTMQKNLAFISPKSGIFGRPSKTPLRRFHSFTINLELVLDKPTKGIDLDAGKSTTERAPDGSQQRVLKSNYLNACKDMTLGQIQSHGSNAEEIVKEEPINNEDLQPAQTEHNGSNVGTIDSLRLAKEEEDTAETEARWEYSESDKYQFFNCDDLNITEDELRLMENIMNDSPQTTKLQKQKIVSVREMQQKSDLFQQPNEDEEPGKAFSTGSKLFENHLNDERGLYCQNDVKKISPNKNINEQLNHEAGDSTEKLQTAKEQAGKVDTERSEEMKKSIKQNENVKIISVIAINSPKKGPEQRNLHEIAPRASMKDINEENISGREEKIQESIKKAISIKEIIQMRNEERNESEERSTQANIDNENKKSPNSEEWLENILKDEIWQLEKKKKKLNASPKKSRIQKDVNSSTFDLNVTKINRSLEDSTADAGKENDNNIDKCTLTENETGRKMKKVKQINVSSSVNPLKLKQIDSVENQKKVEKNILNNVENDQNNEKSNKIELINKSEENEEQDSSQDWFKKNVRDETCRKEKKKSMFTSKTECDKEEIISSIKEKIEKPETILCKKTRKYNISEENDINFKACLEDVERNENRRKNGSLSPNVKAKMLSEEPTFFKMQDTDKKQEQEVDILENGRKNDNNEKLKKIKFNIENEEQNSTKQDESDTAQNSSHMDNAVNKKILIEEPVKNMNKTEELNRPIETTTDNKIEENDNKIETSSSAEHEAGIKGKKRKKRNEVKDETEEQNISQESIENILNRIERKEKNKKPLSISPKKGEFKEENSNAINEDFSKENTKSGKNHEKYVSKDYSKTKEYDCNTDNLSENDAANNAKTSSKISGAQDLNNTSDGEEGQKDVHRKKKQTLSIELKTNRNEETAEIGEQVCSKTRTDEKKKRDKIHTQDKTQKDLDLNLSQSSGSSDKESAKITRKSKKNEQEHNDLNKNNLDHSDNITINKRKRKTPLSDEDQSTSTNAKTDDTPIKNMKKKRKTSEEGIKKKKQTRLDQYFKKEDNEAETHGQLNTWHSTPRREVQNDSSTSIDEEQHNRNTKKKRDTIMDVSIKSEECTSDGAELITSERKRRKKKKHQTDFEPGTSTDSNYLENISELILERSHLDENDQLLPPSKDSSDYPELDVEHLSIREKQNIRNVYVKALYEHYIQQKLLADGENCNIQAPVFKKVRRKHKINDNTVLVNESEDINMVEEEEDVKNESISIGENQLYDINELRIYTEEHEQAITRNETTKDKIHGSSNEESIIKEELNQSNASLNAQPVDKRQVKEITRNETKKDKMNKNNNSKNEESIIKEELNQFNALLNAEPVDKRPVKEITRNETKKDKMKRNNGSRNEDSIRKEELNQSSAALNAEPVDKRPVKEITGKETKKDKMKRNNSSKNEETIINEELNQSNTSLNAQPVDKVKEITDKTKRNKSSKNEETITKEELNNSCDDKDTDLDETYIQEMRQIIQSLPVQISWPIPALHRAEKRLGMPLTLKEKRKLEADGVKIRNGRFTGKEDRLIKSNWGEFCKEHQLGDEFLPVFLKFRRGVTAPEDTESRLNFARFLARGLENRTLHCVYFRFRRLFGSDQRRRPFSRREDKLIRRFMRGAKAPQPYVDLSRVLNRSGLAIQRRAEVLADRKRMERWSEGSERKLISTLCEVTQCEIPALKDLEISLEEWKEASRRMNMPIRTIRHSWQFRTKPKVFAVEDGQSTGEMRARIVQLVKKQNVSEFHDIDWVEIQGELAEDFPGCSSGYFRMKFREMILHHVGPEHREQLQDCLEKLETSKFQDFKIRKIYFDELRMTCAPAREFPSIGLGEVIASKRRLR